MPENNFPPTTSSTSLGPREIPVGKPKNRTGYPDGTAATSCLFTTATMVVVFRLLPWRSRREHPHLLPRRVLRCFQRASSRCLSKAHSFSNRRSTKCQDKRGNQVDIIGSGGRFCHIELVEGGFVRYIPPSRHPASVCEQSGSSCSWRVPHGSNTAVTPY